MPKFYAILLISLLILTENTIKAQKINTFHQILGSKNIIDISYYLKKLHKDNPQYIAVLNRLNQLKSGRWESEPKLLLSIIPTTESLQAKNSEVDEKQEFHDLIQESSEIHDKKAVKLLNNIFSRNKAEKESVLLVRNDSSCDIILRLQGNEQYNLAISAKGENFINLKKDSYVIKGKVCNSDYSNTKDLTSNQIITLRYSEKK